MTDLDWTALGWMFVITSVATGILLIVLWLDKRMYK